MDIEQYCDLLIVRDLEHRRLYVVEAPTHEANVAGLVAFEDGKDLHFGLIVDKMWCQRDGEAYRCMQRMCPIYKATATYFEGWTAEPENG